MAPATGGRSGLRVGASSCGMSVTRSSSSKVDSPGEHVTQAALEERSHAVGPGGVRDLVGGGALADTPLDLGVHRQHLDDAEPAAVAGLGALRAAHRACTAAFPPG